MSLLVNSLRRLPALQGFFRNNLGYAAFATHENPKHPAADTPTDPLKKDKRTQEPQEMAHETDEATKDSIRHAAEGEFGEAVKDVGRMAKNAAKGAASSAKLMKDSKVGGSEELKEDLKSGEKA